MKRTTVGACALAFAAFAALVALGGEATAQQKTLKERLAGTWHFVIAEVTAPDGKKSFPFGPTPRGMVIFTPGGDFMQIHIASEVPRWYWDGRRIEVLPPVPFEEELLGFID